MVILRSVCQCSSLCSSVVLLCLLCSSANSQSVRTGFIRDEVLLPCIYSKHLLEPIIAFWRDKNDKVVLDIINSKEDKIDPKFRASSQSVRTGFIGGEVLLPCVYSEQLSEPVNAFWRDKDDKVVLDIINGKEDKMDPKFTGRVFSFPDQYETGNLSIIIKGLKADDAGPYECDIPKVGYQVKMTLNVTEKPAVKITTPHPEPPTTRGAAVTTSEHHLPLLSAPLFVLFSSLK